MTVPASPPIFDGHNDVLLRLWRQGGDAEAFLEGDGRGHLDLPRMQAGGLAGGLFAVFVPSDELTSSVEELMRGPSYDVPLPGAIELARAQRAAFAMVALLARIERAAKGRLRVCRSAAEIRAAFAADALAAVLHFEGAEAIDPDLDVLEVLYRAGLRSLGPVWSRPNPFGHGVPFRYPSSPDIGPGLTDAGRALIKACNELRILIDLSHLNEQGFWDVARASDAPLVASHSNAHALSPHARNLTDRQLAAIRESGGLVGVNFAACFIRKDGRVDTETPLDDLVRHVDHLIEHVGVDGVGFGSDFDGATVPAGIGDAAGLPRLIETLRRHGYDDTVLRKLCSENWLRVLERTWSPGTAGVPPASARSAL